MGNSNLVGFKKELRFSQLVILGAGTGLGTGLLFSVFGMVTIGGGAAIIGALIGSLIFIGVAVVVAEMGPVYLEAGAPARWSLYSHGRLANLIIALSNYVAYLFIIPTEALAVVEGLDFFAPSVLTPSGTPTILGAAIAVAIMLVLTPINYYGVRIFGKVTQWAGGIKLLIYFLLPVVLIIVYFSPKNFTLGGFAPYGYVPVFAGIPLALFVFGGARIIADYSAEIKDTKRITLAIITAALIEVAALILVYFAFTGGINWSKLSVAEGNFAGLSSVVSGNPFNFIAFKYGVLGFIVIAVIAAILGPLVDAWTVSGQGSRVLYSVAKSKAMPSRLLVLHERHAVPEWALLVTVAIGAVIAFISAPLPTIYGLITDAIVVFYLGFGINGISMIVSRRQGITKRRLPFGYVFAGIAFIGSSLGIFWSGWPSVPYGFLILLILAVFLGIIYKVKGEVKNSLWIIGYLAFLTIMAYIGSDGGLELLGYLWSSFIVLVVSAIVFLPLGVYSGISAEYLKSKILGVDTSAEKGGSN